MRLAAAALLGIAALTGVDTSAAYSTANIGSSLFYPRNCHDEKVAISTQKPQSAEPALVPLKKIARPAPLTVVPHLVDDAAYAEPVPEHAGPAPETPSVVVIHLEQESRNHWGCLGIQRGKAGILRVLSAPPGTRFYGHPFPASFIGDNMLGAIAFDVKEAIPPIRLILERPPVPHDIERTSLRAQAAHALAMLGDHESTGKIEALATEFETMNLAFVWRSTFLSLVEIDPERASKYAVALLGRMTSDKPPSPINLDEARIVLSHIHARDAAAALPLLQKMSAKEQFPNSYPGHSMCHVLQARVRLGDPAFAKVVKGAIEGTLDNNLATVCYSQLIESFAPGQSTKELKLLEHRGRYEALAELALSVRANGTAADRTAVLATLRRLSASSMSHFQNRKGQFGIGAQYGHLLSALALAGDDKSVTELNALVEAPSELTDAPWIAARYAVLGDLPGASARARKRLEIGMKRGIDHGNLDTMGVGVAVGEGVKLVRALASKNDPTFALGLLVDDFHTREASLLLLSRKKPTTACTLLTDDAKLAREEAVEAAFWGMSALGTACRSQMEALAATAQAPDYVSKLAIEHLAMTRAPIDRFPRQWRAAIIASSPE